MKKTLFLLSILFLIISIGGSSAFAEVVPPITGTTTLTTKPSNPILTRLGLAPKKKKKKKLTSSRITKKYLVLNDKSSVFYNGVVELTTKDDVLTSMNIKKDGKLLQSFKVTEDLIGGYLQNILRNTIIIDDISGNFADEKGIIIDDILGGRVLRAQYVSTDNVISSDLQKTIVIEDQVMLSRNADNRGLLKYSVPIPRALQKSTIVIDDVSGNVSPEFYQPRSLIIIDDLNGTRSLQITSMNGEVYTVKNPKAIRFVGSDQGNVAVYRATDSVTGLKGVIVIDDIQGNLHVKLVDSNNLVVQDIVIDDVSGL